MNFFTAFIDIRPFAIFFRMTLLLLQRDDHYLAREINSERYYSTKARGYIEHAVALAVSTTVLFVDKARWRPAED